MNRSSSAAGRNWKEGQLTKNRFTQVGLDRVLRFNWLEKTAALVTARNNARTIKALLQEDLKGSFETSRMDVRGSIDKTITILLRIWLTSPKELDSLRIEGLELLKSAGRQQRLVIHWGMVMAIYPFWFGVAIQVGRLLRLQGTATAAQVQRRVREQYGERETVARRARYVLRSYLDWGVLQETGKQGVYSAAKFLPIEEARTIAWLTEAALHSRGNDSASLGDLLESPAFFPFRIAPVYPDTLATASSRLDILRQGADETLVMLRSTSEKRG